VRRLPAPNVAGGRFAAGARWLRSVTSQKGTPRAMTASLIKVSLPLSGTAVHPSRASSRAAPPPPSVEQAPAAKTPASGAAPAAGFRVSPAWPDPASINLAGELLDLSTTALAYTATREPPETGADFWAMLASALPEGRRD